MIVGGNGISFQNVNYLLVCNRKYMDNVWPISQSSLYQSVAYITV